MSREIKFRAWVESNKQMYNVDVLAISACSWDCPDHGKHGFSLAYQPHIPVMQFTGMVDCDGKEIYEGDIIEHDFKPCGMQRDEVVFEDNCFCLQYGNKYMPSQRDRKVIGNSYENPELLSQAA